MSMGMEEEDDFDPTQRYVQWTTSDGKCFFPASRSVGKLEPGLYEIHMNQQGMIFFDQVSVGTEGLLEFPETASQAVVREIETFWERKELFVKHNLAFKRGIMLYGPPGSGKTCTIKLAINDLVRRKGIVVKFTRPEVFAEGIRVFREIQKDTPLIVLMEDIDSILENYCESDVINILDGVDGIDSVVFLATTNYPEKLGPRILNRPSRFDKRFKIGMPNEASRRIYLRSLMTAKKEIDLERWVRDTDQFSIAHLKELFVAVIFLGDPYEEALKTLRSMGHRISSEHDGEKMGLLEEDEISNMLGQEGKEYSKPKSR